jgi:hypothetical protein
LWKNQKPKNFRIVYLIVNKILLIVIADYGTKPDIFVCPFLPQYIEPSPLNLGIGRESHADLNQPIKIVKKEILDKFYPNSLKWN